MAAPAWPVAHIANLGWLAVAVNVALIAVFTTVATRLSRDPAHHSDRTAALA